MNTFQSILDTEVTAAVRPPAFPGGSWIAVVQGLPRRDKSTKKGTDFIEYTIGFLAPLMGENGEPADIDPDALAEFGDCAGKPMKLTFYMTEASAYRHREFPLSAQLQAKPFPFGQFMPTENFVIALQSRFIQDETTAAMLALVGNLTTTKESRTLDDGVSQTVEARVGISKLQTVVVPNPVQLRPYRTFLEIEQPLSNFVFRVDAKDHSCALFEADGGFWKNVATSFIKERLQRELAEFVEKEVFTILA